jgi:hypothetical protein
MSADDEKISLPTPDEIIASEGFNADASNDIQIRYENIFASESVQAQVDYTHLRGLQDHYWHKGKWSFFIMGIMAVMVMFQSYLLYKVGTNQWDFTRYAWLLPALMVQNLGQIVALALVVVKSLFR